jgi:hypothetical protein
MSNSFSPTARPILQRKCACGGTVGLGGECEACRKKRLRLQRRPIAGSGSDLRLDESAAREAEADAIANQIVSGSSRLSGVPVPQRLSLGGIQRQRRPEEILPQRHVPNAPTMRPVGAEVVRGFAVTRATCGCASEVTAREKAIDDRISAYTTCGARKDVRDPFALEACVRKKVFGMSGPRVPALGTADPETSTVQMADASDLALREKLLGEPAEGPCVALRTRAMLVHEGQHLEQFDRIAKQLGSGFFQEFKKLEGDPQRIEKLQKKFPNETAKYESAWQTSVSNNVQAETESYTAEREFFGGVRTAWPKVCGSSVPAPEVGPPKNEPGRGKVQRRASNNETSEVSDVPKVVGEVLGTPGEPLDVTTRTFMQERFGHDFGRVRVHADPLAAESASAVNAEAYTVGQHIAFAADRYNPSSEHGRRLLAHELTHTLQQDEGVRPARISDAHNQSEKEAEAIAERIPSQSYNTYLSNRAALPITRSRQTGTWLARKQTPWPPWHQQVLTEISKFAGPSDGKSAEAKWPQMVIYLCKLSPARAATLHERLSPSAPGLSQGTDKFAVYVKTKFPVHHADIIRTLGDLKGLTDEQIKKGKHPSLCEPKKETPLPSSKAMLDESLQKLSQMIPDPGPKPEKDVPIGGYTNCTDDQAIGIRDAIWRAIDDLDAAIKLLEARPLDVRAQNALFVVIRSNDEKTGDTVLANLRKIRAGIAKLEFECDPAGEMGFCKLEGTVAFTNKFNNKVHICLGEWDSTTVEDERPRTIVHEGAHAFAGAPGAGEAYFNETCEDLAKMSGLSPAARLMQADSTACVVYHLVHRTAEDVKATKEVYSGEALTRILQVKKGPISLSADPSKTYFSPSKVPAVTAPNIKEGGGFAYRWRLSDNAGNHYLLVGKDSDEPLDWKDFTDQRNAIIGRKTRDLLASRGVKKGVIECTVRIPEKGEKTVSLNAEFTD